MFPKGAGLPLAGRLILVAGMGVDAQTLYVAAIERAGGTVTPVDDRRAAVQAVEAATASGRAFDLAVLEHSVPYFDGIETAFALRASRFKGLLIRLTACLDAANTQRWHDHGCAFVLPKSLPLPVFVAWLAVVNRGYPA